MDRMSLPYIKSMEAAAKKANNADLLMLIKKMDSDKMTAPESGMGALDGYLREEPHAVDDAPKIPHRLVAKK